MDKLTSSPVPSPTKQRDKEKKGRKYETSHLLQCVKSNQV